MSTRFEPIISVPLSFRDGLPYSSIFDDIYFSSSDGLAEARHVFIKGNQLVDRWQHYFNHHATFVIGELGFGSGLNILLAWQYFKNFAPSHAKLHFISVEKYPLSHEDLARCWSLWPELAIEAQHLLSVYPMALTPGFHHCHLDERVSLTLMLGEAEALYDEVLVSGDLILEPQLRSFAVDAWFLDGFAPSKNPQMWSYSLLTKLGCLSKPGTTFATFSVAGAFRRDLKAAGFQPMKQRGFAQKREMTVGFFEGHSNHQSHMRYTPWQVSNHQASKQKAIILGAGLAGCFTAHALAKRGWDVILIDQHAAVGQGASGNRQAVLYPNLSAYRAPLTIFMLQTYLYAVGRYQAWIHQQLIRGELSGILQLALDEKTKKMFRSLALWLQHYPRLGCLLDAREASERAGLSVDADGLFVPDAGWIDAPSVCQFLVQHPHIQYRPSTTITEIEYKNNMWSAGQDSAPVLVIANGFQASSFSQTQHLSLTTFRGQMTAVKSQAATETLQLPICASGHILPAQQGLHWVGATYHPGLTDQSCRAIDDEENLKILHNIPIGFSSDLTDIQDHWAGIRAATRDYLPFVGPVADPVVFNQQLNALKAHARVFIPVTGQQFQPGLYLCAGFGSRGLTTIPWCAEYLAATIAQDPFPCSRTMIQSISPARFLRKALTHERNSN